MEFLLIWLIFGVVSSVIASSKGHSGCSYFILGLLLGPIGLLVAIFISGKNEPRAKSIHRVACEFCGFNKGNNALFCPACGKDEDGFNQSHYQSIANDSAYRAESEAVKEMKNKEINDKKREQSYRDWKFLFISSIIIAIFIVGFYVFRLLSVHFENQKRLKVGEYEWNEKNFEQKNALSQFIVFYNVLLLFKDQTSFHGNGFYVSPYIDWMNALMVLKEDEMSAKYLKDRDINVDDLIKMAYE